jgi:hypothetical protein
MEYMNAADLIYGLRFAEFDISGGAPGTII